LQQPALQRSAKTRKPIQRQIFVLSLPNLSCTISRANNEQPTSTTRIKEQDLETSAFGQSLTAREQLVNLFAKEVSDIL
jgi:hypothetical protein